MADTLTNVIMYATVIVCAFFAGMTFQKEVTRNAEVAITYNAGAR